HGEHPQPYREAPGQPEIVHTLIDERGKGEHRGSDVRREHDDDRFSRDEPAEDFHAPGRAALTLGRPQLMEGRPEPWHGVAAGHLRIFLTAPTASSTGLALGAAAWASFKRTSEIWPATISHCPPSATRRAWGSRRSRG